MVGNKWLDMARPRKHDQKMIIDVIERVLARDGVLTVDAVALEAGVSKATVLYDHKSKRDLMAAMVYRAIEADNAFNVDCAREQPDGPDAILRGRIKAAWLKPATAGDNSAVLGLVAALLQDAGLREKFRDNQGEILEGVFADASDLRATRLAWLALEGLKLQEHLEFHRWPVKQREEILRDIETLALTGAISRQDHDKND